MTFCERHIGDCTHIVAFLGREAHNGRSGGRTDGLAGGRTEQKKLHDEIVLLLFFLVVEDLKVSNYL